MKIWIPLALTVSSFASPALALWQSPIDKAIDVARRQAAEAREHLEELLATRDAQPTLAVRQRQETEIEWETVDSSANGKGEPKHHENKEPFTAIESSHEAPMQMLVAASDLGSNQGGCNMNARAPERAVTSVVIESSGKTFELSSIGDNMPLGGCSRHGEITFAGKDNDCGHACGGSAGTPPASLKEVAVKKGCDKTFPIELQAMTKFAHQREMDCPHPARKNMDKSHHKTIKRARCRTNSTTVSGKQCRNWKKLGNRSHTKADWSRFSTDAKGADCKNKAWRHMGAGSQDRPHGNVPCMQKERLNCENSRVQWEPCGSQKPVCDSVFKSEGTTGEEHCGSLKPSCHSNETVQVQCSSETSSHSKVDPEINGCMNTDDELRTLTVSGFFEATGEPFSETDEPNWVTGTFPADSSFYFDEHEIDTEIEALLDQLTSEDDKDQALTPEDVTDLDGKIRTLVLEVTENLGDEEPFMQDAEVWVQVASEKESRIEELESEVAELRDLVESLIKELNVR